MCCYSYLLIDWDGAAQAKSEANEAKASSNYDLAVQKFTLAMEKGGASALTLANRAECLLKIRRPLAALSDCDEALKLNPDSAKALRCRGTVCRHMGRWEEANKNLAAAQAIDFMPELEELRNFVNAKAAAIEAEKVISRILINNLANGLFLGQTAHSRRRNPQGKS